MTRCKNRLPRGKIRSDRHTCRYSGNLLLAIALVLVVAHVSAGTAASESSVPVADSGPRIVNVTVYIVDFSRFDVTTGTVGADFYLNLKSDSPVSIDDFELMNGMTSSVSPILDTPHEKEYRVTAVLTVEPNLARYPFDRHTLAIRMEPKLKNEQEMVLVVNRPMSGINDEANLPGWELSGTRYYTTNNSYYATEIPYSRVVFEYNIVRDVTSTVLKFFLPLMLIILISLASLLMKTSSRLGLNASMLLAAVLIHWRIADAIPIVAYATFLDLFMIITYATLAMVLLSGILVIVFTESQNAKRVGQINYWSVRVIPPVSLVLYLVVVITLLV